MILYCIHFLRCVAVAPCRCMRRKHIGLKSFIFLLTFLSLSVPFPAFPLNFVVQFILFVRFHIFLNWCRLSVIIGFNEESLILQSYLMWIWIRFLYYSRFYFVFNFSFGIFFLYTVNLLKCAHAHTASHHIIFTICMESNSGARQALSADKHLNFFYVLFLLYCINSPCATSY